MAFPTGYTNYQEVTVDNTKVPADLTNYVIYVDLSNLSKAGADIFDTCRSDGGDIRVTKTDGTTELAREIVAIDTTGKTGELHVKFTGTLSSSVDTTIRIWYNGTDTEPAVTATYGRNNVWGDYEAVLHFEADGTDSTGNGDFTLTGTEAYATGKMGQGLTFNGTDTRAYASRTGLDAIDGADFTFSGWVEPDADASGYLFIKGSQGGDWIGAFQDTAFSRYGWNVDNGVSNTFASHETNLFQSGDVTHFAWTRNGTAGRIYCNAGTAGTITHHTNEDTTSETTGGLHIGVRWTGSAYSSYNSAMYSEFRAKVGSYVSEDWNDAEYINQNTPSTFYATGDEVGGGGDPVVLPTPTLSLLGVG